MRYSRTNPAAIVGIIDLQTANDTWELIRFPQSHAHT
jgi:hypothetical protein